MNPELRILSTTFPAGTDDGLIVIPNSVSVTSTVVVPLVVVPPPPPPDVDAIPIAPMAHTIAMIAAIAIPYIKFPFWAMELFADSVDILCLSFIGASLRLLFTINTFDPKVIIHINKSCVNIVTYFLLWIQDKLISKS